MERIIKDNCLLCNKKFEWNETVIWKLPENCWFCLNCIDRFDDYTQYEWIDTWITQEYQPWITYEYKN